MKIPKKRTHARGQLCCDYNGKTVYFGKAADPSSHDRYDAWVRDVVLRSRSRPTLPANGAECKVAHLVECYLDFALGYYVKGEYTNLRLAAIVPADLFGGTYVNEFGPLCLEAVQSAMVAKGWCRTRVNDQVKRVRRMFRWAVSKEICRPEVVVALTTVAPLRKGRTTAPERPRIKPADQGLVDAVLPFLSRQVAAMVRLNRIVGMRPGELCRIRGCDIDKSSAKVWAYRPDSHKTEHRGRDLVYYLGPIAQEILKPFDTSSSRYVFSPAEATREFHERRGAERKTKPAKSRPAKAEFPKIKPGKRYTPNSYRVAIGRGVARLRTSLTKTKEQMPGFHPHQLRHSRATQVRAVYGIEASKVAMGHATIDATEIYAETDAALARKIALETG